MIAFPLRRMQPLITRNDLLWAITIASLYCNVLRFIFGYLLHPRADGTAQSYLFLCLEVYTSFLIMLKLIKLATGIARLVFIIRNGVKFNYFQFFMLT